MKGQSIKQQQAIQIPKLSAKNASQEPWRIQRLKRIVAQLNSFNFGGYSNGLLKKLVSLHDENNTLRITWASKPSKSERKFTREVWWRESEGASENK